MSTESTYSAAIRRTTCCFRVRRDPRRTAAFPRPSKPRPTHASAPRPVTALATAKARASGGKRRRRTSPGPMRSRPAWTCSQVAFTRSANPVVTSVTSVTRNWSDTNGNFIPDCDLTNPLLNGECGIISNLNFGLANPRATTNDPATNRGWGARGYNWETSAAVQHELTKGLSVNVAYFRRWY